MHEIEGKCLILHPIRQRVAVVALPTIRKGARVAEEARLESVLTSKASRGFESPSFRRNADKHSVSRRSPMRWTFFVSEPFCTI